MWARVTPARINDCQSAIVLEARMVNRRKVMGRSLQAGVAALVLPTSAVAAEQANRGDRERDVQAIVNAIDELRAEIVKTQECSLGPCSAVAAIRLQQNIFLKANQKFPDFIDAGVEIWEAVYDWHVRNNQPINTTRLPDGRYGILFMFTTVVLRPDNTPNYLSFGYDATR